MLFPSTELQPNDISIQATLAMISTFQIYLKYQTGGAPMNVNAEQ